jgi:hypothetical protein
MCFSISNNQAERAPNPAKAYEVLLKSAMLDEVVNVAGISLNMALEAAANEQQPAKLLYFLGVLGKTTAMFEWRPFGGNFFVPRKG